MIKLRIENWFSQVCSEDGEVFCLPVVKPFDLSKYADGCIHEFETIGECRDFMSGCRIEFTEDYRSQFCDRWWEEIHHTLSFDTEDDNMLVACIWNTEEYRD